MRHPSAIPWTKSQTVPSVNYFRHYEKWGGVYFNGRDAPRCFGLRLINRWPGFIVVSNSRPFKTVPARRHLSGHGFVLSRWIRVSPGRGGGRGELWETISKPNFFLHRCLGNVFERVIRKVGGWWRWEGMVFMKVLDVVILEGGGVCALRRMRGRGSIFFFFGNIWLWCRLYRISFFLFWILSCTNFKIVEIFFLNFKRRNKFCTFPFHGYERVCTNYWIITMNLKFKTLFILRKVLCICIFSRIAKSFILLLDYFRIRNGNKI